MKNQLVWGFPNEQSVTAGEISGSDQYVERTFTKAEILTLGTYKEILPATPNNTYYDITKAVIEFKPKSGDYGTPKGNIELTNGIFIGQVDDNMATEKSPKVSILINKAPAASVSGYGSIGYPLYFGNTAGNFSDPGGNANGTLKVKVWYQIRQIV
jgi:hypothetical protein